MAIHHYDYPNVKSVVICGDIHGEFEKLVYQCCVRYKMRDTLIIVAGDCGFGFHAPIYYINFCYGRLYDRLERANVSIACVRGNHDDPFYFKTKCVSSDHFRTVEDYSVITACGHQILCVGGAVSIDRDQRTAGKDWWEDEKPVFNIGCLNLIYAGFFMIDTVVTHTAPSFCEFTMPSMRFEHSLLTDMQEERRVMDDLLERLRHDGHPLRRWFYGHFHHSWNAQIDGIDYTMLGIMEMKELFKKED